MSDNTRHNLAQSEDWQQAETLFDAAVKLPPAERAALLDRVSEQQPALREEVESLLAADENASDFLRSPFTAGSQGGEQPARMGRYHLLKRIGQGSTGIVYLARRADQPFEQRVAIKVLRAGANDESHRRRFDLEQRILAGLEHPNLARLLDGGVTDDGRPYLVMEYVQGLAIDAYCDLHRLRVGERLELMRTVAQAVQYAHQNLVIHRDIKPGNILVSAKGVPKLLDFGIAKLLNPALMGAAEPTATWVRLLTPHYASPEQVRGQPVTTATDIYSLGVLLFKLLTGCLPYAFQGTSMEEVERVLREEEPVAPSVMVRRPLPGAAAGSSDQTGSARRRSRARGLEPLARSRRLAGDLDAIVLTALRMEPQRRYASAEQLAEDLRRHRLGLPVRACRDTMRYRTAKFLRRHRVAVGVALGVLTLVFGSLLALGWQSTRLAHERDRAQQQERRATRALDFVISLFDISSANRNESPVMTARQVLDRGLEHVHRDLASDPAMQASLLGALGTAYCQMGSFEPGIQALEEAVALARRHARSKPALADLADALGIQLRNRGELKRAEALHREALEIYRDAYGAHHPSVARALAHVARVLHTLGELEQAGVLYRQALAIQRETLEPNDPGIRMTLNDLGLLATHRGDYAGAQRLLHQVLRLENSAGAKQTVNRAATLNNLGQVLYETGDLAGAEALLGEALAIHRKLLGEHHPKVAQGEHNLGAIFLAEGRYDQAKPRLEAALALWRQNFGDNHQDVATAMNSLGNCLYRLGDLQQAEDLLRRSEALYRTLLGDEHPLRGRALLALGRLENALGRSASAEQRLRLALEIWRAKLPEDHWWLAQGESVLGESLLRQGHWQRAEPLLVASYPRIEAQLGSRDPETRDARQRLVALYRAAGDPERAAAYRELPPAPETPAFAPR